MPNVNKVAPKVEPGAVAVDPTKSPYLNPITGSMIPFWSMDGAFGSTQDGNDIFRLVISCYMKELRVCLECLSKLSSI